jgi:hypothetical protein
LNTLNRGFSYKIKILVKNAKKKIVDASAKKLKLDHPEMLTEKMMTFYSFAICILKIGSYFFDVLKDLAVVQVIHEKTF